MKKKYTIYHVQTPSMGFFQTIKTFKTYKAAAKLAHKMSGGPETVRINETTYFPNGDLSCASEVWIYEGLIDKDYKEVKSS